MIILISNYRLLFGCNYEPSFGHHADLFEKNSPHYHNKLNFVGKCPIYLFAASHGSSFKTVHFNKIKEVIKIIINPKNSPSYDLITGKILEELSQKGF